MFKISSGLRVFATSIHCPIILLNKNLGLLHLTFHDITSYYILNDSIFTKYSELMQRRMLSLYYANMEKEKSSSHRSQPLTDRSESVVLSA